MGCQKVISSRETCASENCFTKNPKLLYGYCSIPITVCNKIEKMARGFLWGSLANIRKPSLVGWTECCKPIASGGLGLRKLRDQNKLFLLKLGYQLIINIDAFWVRVLRNKYKVYGLIPSSIQRSNCLIWDIRDGKLANFWNDEWLKDVGCLKHVFTGQGVLNEAIRVCDVVLENGDWDKGLAIRCSPTLNVQQILACDVPLERRCPDMITWKWTAAGKFSMSESFKHIFSDMISLDHNKFKMIWKLPTP